MKYLKFLLPALVLSTSSVADGAELDPLAAASFQPSPFSGVCEGVALLPHKEYVEHKPYWDDVIPRCGVDVQVLPDTGFLSALTFRLGQAVNKDENVDFLRKVGKRTLENIDFNNKVSELWIHCAKADTAWIEARRASAVSQAGGNQQLADAERDFYDPAKCSSRLSGLKDVLKKNGRQYRINRELMRYTGSAESAVVSGLVRVGDTLTAGELELRLPGEKVALSAEEAAEVERLKRQVDEKARATLEKEKSENLRKVAELKKDGSLPLVGPGSALDDPSIPGWFRQWYIETDGGKRPNAVTARPYDQQQFLARRGAQSAGFLRDYAKALGDARILAFLDARDPSDAQLAAAAERLLDNGKKLREKTAKVVAAADGSKGDASKVDALASLMQNGPVLRELLTESPASCHTAAGIANYLAAKDARFKGAMFVGGLAGGFTLAYVGPAALGAAGLSAGSAALAASVLSTTIGVVSGGSVVAGDYARFAAAKQRTLSEVHGDPAAFGAGRPVAEMEELAKARDTLVVDFAITAAEIAAPIIYHNFFSGEASKAVSSDAVMKKLTEDPKLGRGGLGLTEGDAKKLLADAFSRDQSVAKPAMSRLSKALGLEESQLSAMQEAVTRELAAADVKEGNVSSKTFLERVLSRFHSTATKPDPEAYQRLRGNGISQYFPDTKEVQVQPMFKTTGASLTDAAVKKFQADFDSLLDQRAALFDLKAGDFRAWLVKKNGSPYPKLDPVAIETVFKKQGATLEDFQSALYLNYAMEMKSQGVDVLSHLHVKELGRLGFLLSKKTVGFFVGAFTTALTVGPVTNVVNSVFSAPMQPITESAAQLSNVMFANMTSAISKSLSKNMKKVTSSMAQVSSTTNQLDETKFEGMSREDAKKLMEGFDQRYTEIFMRMSAYMPPYKRAGRDVMRDWWLLQPIQLATNASTFNMEFTMNQALLVAVKDKVKDRAPTEEEKQLMQQYQENMETAENRLAVALATWKIYSFTYVESARDPMLADANAKMFNALQHYEKFMNMDKYRVELSSKIKEAFLQFDPSFKELNTLEHRRTE